MPWAKGNGAVSKFVPLALAARATQLQRPA